MPRRPAAVAADLEALSELAFLPAPACEACRSTRRVIATPDGQQLCRTCAMAALRAAEARRRSLLDANEDLLVQYDEALPSALPSIREALAAQQAAIVRAEHRAAEFTDALYPDPPEAGDAEDEAHAEQEAAEHYEAVAGADLDRRLAAAPCAVGLGHPIPVLPAEGGTVRAGGLGRVTILGLGIRPGTILVAVKEGPGVRPRIGTADRADLLSAMAALKADADAAIDAE